MISKAQTPDEYIASMPEEDRTVLESLRNRFNSYLPEGYQELMAWGMITWAVPHTLFPEGYHAYPGMPLPFISIASKKHHYAVYHMGLYADNELLEWFTTRYLELTGKKPDMGKSCVRFKKGKEIPANIIEELAGKVSPKSWVSLYTRSRS